MNESAESEVRGGGTADALLEVATRRFAADGYDGASIRDITRAAGANLGAVTYHFGSKRELYKAVLVHCFDPVRRRVAAAAEGPGTALDRVRAILRVFFDALETEPAIPQLMLRETVAGRQPNAPELEPVRRILALVAGVIEEGQRGGLIRPGEPLLMAISTVAQPVHLTLMSRLALVSGREGEIERSGLVDHAIAYAHAGLSREGVES